MNGDSFATRSGGWLRKVAAAAVIAILPAISSGQEYPSKPIRLIVPFSPGGNTDVIGRRFVQQLSAALKQPVIIENRPGGATNIASELVARAAPDGYTLLWGQPLLTTNAVFGPTQNFDVSTAFTPIGMVAHLPFAVTANTAAPFDSIEQLLAAARKEPGKFTIGTGGLDVLVELMKTRANIDILHVRYKGGADALVDVLGGRIDMTMIAVPALLSHIRGGKLKALGIASSKRMAVLPAVPTFREAGIDYEASFWFGLLAPADTPKDIVNRLAAETRRIVESQDFVSFIEQNGGNADASGPAEMRDMMNRELAQWRDLGKKNPKLLPANANK